MAGTKVATAFGLKDVAIATRPTTGSTTPTWVDIPSVESAAFKLNIEEVEQYGDDSYQGAFYHSPKGQITVKGNKLSMKVFELLSGNTVSTSGTAEIIQFGTVDELIPPRVIVRATVGVRMEDGTAGEMTAYFYNTDVKTVWDSIPGGERAKLGEVNLMFNCYISTQDEKGDALATNAFGRFELA
jgi:hypothetical protein